MTASTASNIHSTSGARRPIGRRAIVALAISASATLGLSACGSGQITQTSSQASGVTGAEGRSGSIAVHNVQLIYPSQENAREQDQLNISFVAVNTDAKTPDTLKSITVKGQELALLDGDFTIRPKSSISTPQLPSYSGAKTEQTTTQAPTTTANDPLGVNPPPAEVTVKAIDNAKVGAIGESVPVVFTFSNADPIELSTPIAMWHDVPRQTSQATAPAQD